MTAEEKQKVKNTAFGMLNENKEEIITEAFTEAVEDMAGEIEDRTTEEERQKMIDDGTLADHTIKQNKIRLVGEIARFFGKKLTK